VQITDLKSTVKTRFAPTPSGYLHAGNAFNFLKNWLAARENSAGKILLRIDDLDAERKRSEYVEDIFRTLDWLKFDWDDGPNSPDDFEKNWSQKTRISLYENLLNALKNRDLLFVCGKSRQELAAFGNFYPIKFRVQNLDFDAKNAAWRIKTPTDFLMQDFIIRRKDGVPAYQIASVADDIFFKITDIFRGADLENSSMAQLFLAEKLSLKAFLKINISHHPILKNELGEKLSKSAGANSLKMMRESGKKPIDLLPIYRPFLTENEFQKIENHWSK
jgi:glutamyl-tRNA synthetase